jgi:hypothetical protein
LMIIPMRRQRAPVAEPLKCHSVDTARRAKDREMERETSGVALASTNWCAVVVLPQRLPATMLKENSGMPPPKCCC